MGMSRRSLRVSLSALLVAGALLAGCGGGGGAGTIVVGMQADFGGINPVTNTDQYTGELIDYALFTPLIRYDANLQPAPYLARSWTMEGDTAVVFDLRHDVHWQDGPPVTAEDVKFTFGLAKDSVTASLLGSVFLAQVKSAEVLDTFRIRFDFARPHAQALEDFWWAPVPKHLLDTIPPIELKNAAYNRHPVGSGPYRFAGWRQNDRLVIEPNPAFPQALGGVPAARIVFRVIPEPATTLTELLTGGIQVDIPVEPDQGAKIKATPGYTLYDFPGNTLYYLGWNNRRAPFDNPAVRRAMTLAINRQEIVDGLLAGYGTVATSTVPPWSPYSPGDVAPLPYDPAHARALLDSAGWRDRNGDGVRENAAGQPLHFTILTSDRPLTRSVVEVVQNQLEAVGAQAELQVLEFQTMLARHKARDFDVVLSNWVLDNFQMAAAPAALFHSRWVDVPNSANRSGVAIPRLDALIDSAAAATDPAAAKRIYREMTLLLQQRQPFTFMFWLSELAAASDAVSGVTMDQRGELSSIARWRIGP
jgi:peptide/nickel transport system substrate-binding protein